MSVVAVLSDIHSNLPALEAVLADADHLGCDETWCLGDLVGYGGSPNECLDLLRGRGAIAVMGNHDAAVVGREDLFCFHPAARSAVEWTLGELSAQNVEFLRGLPDRRVCHARYQLVHGAPDDRSRYLSRAGDLFVEASLLRASGDVEVCFYGHTHVPRISTETQVWIHKLGKRKLDSRDRYFVNPGSVGQPRDDNPLAAWLRLDTDTGCIEFRRVGYDVMRAQEQISDASLPEQLADRLEVGR